MRSFTNITVAVFLYVIASKSEAQVREIAQAVFSSHWRALASNDSSRWAAQFCEPCSYSHLSETDFVSLDDVERHRDIFIRAFPHREYELVSPPHFTTENGDLRIFYRYSFTWRGVKSLSGIAACNLECYAKDGKLYIAGYTHKFESGTVGGTDGLPDRGFFSIDDVFSKGFYHKYNSKTKVAILKKSQKVLSASGIYLGTADGVMGPSTQLAILSFQKSHKLTSDGLLNDRTLSSLGFPQYKEIPDENWAAAWVGRWVCLDAPATGWNDFSRVMGVSQEEGKPVFGFFEENAALLLPNFRRRAGYTVPGDDHDNIYAPQRSGGVNGRITVISSVFAKDYSTLSVSANIAKTQLSYFFTIFKDSKGYGIKTRSGVWPPAGEEKIFRKVGP